MSTENYIEVIYASWYLHDRWGSNEDSGCSLHFNVDDHANWVTRYRNKVMGKDGMPDCYHISRKTQKAKIVSEIQNEMLKTAYGVRYSLEEEEILVKEKKIIVIE